MRFVFLSKLYFIFVPDKWLMWHLFSELVKNEWDFKNSKMNIDSFISNFQW